MLMLDANTYPRLAGIFDLLNFSRRKASSAGLLAKAWRRTPRKLFRDVEGSWCFSDIRPFAGMGDIPIRIRGLELTKLARASIRNFARVEKGSAPSGGCVFGEADGELGSAHQMGVTPQASR